MGLRGSKTRDDRSKAGIILIKLISAKLKLKSECFASISLGQQNFCTATSQQTDTPTWNSEKRILLDRDGPRIARISVFETNIPSKNNLIGYCEIDLFKFLIQDSDSDLEAFDLLDPSSSDIVVGNITVSCSVEDPIETEKSFARRILSIVDYSDDGRLSFSEFTDLINVFGNELAANKKEELFKAADVNGDGVVSMDELATLIATQQQKEPLINCCPVCGETLEVSDNLNNVIHLTLCLDHGTGNQIMTRGNVKDKQAAYGWVLKLSEWTNFSSKNVGVNSVPGITPIMVFDRKTKKLVEEIIDIKVFLGMKVLYQSLVGRILQEQWVIDLLQYTSDMEGKAKNSPESVADIPKFIESFKDQIDIADMKYPLDHYKTFNEFFIRELKDGARPIADKDRDEVAVCAADCRLSAFRNVEDSLRFWIKGGKFSIQGLLGDEVASAFNGGILVIFRLAPQDYHRFHSPVSGTIEKFIDIPGSLYSVNPLAVSSQYCSVFTQNKRVASILSTKDFGKVAYVAIGATVVGSITFTKKEGDILQKGDEMGYFSYGGSSVICVFEKDAIEIDEDLLANSEKSLETLVEVGMTLGVAIKK